MLPCSMFVWITDDRVKHQRDGRSYRGEIKETILFTIASKRIKYLGISLPEESKDLYSENYKNTDESNLYVYRI